MEKDQRIEFAVKHWNKRLKEIESEVQGLSSKIQEIHKDSLYTAIAKDLLTLLNEAGYGKE